jgi:hypothetical protein
VASRPVLADLSLLEVPTSLARSQNISLSTAAETRPSDLVRAQLLLASTASIVSGSAPARGEAPGNLAFVTDPLNVSLLDPFGVPDAARGQKLIEKIGPFVDDSGLTKSVVVVPQTTSTTFAYAGASSGFARLPVQGATTNVKTLTLGAGSVWFAANLLVPAAAGTFCGFLISGGTVVSSAPLTLSGGAYTIPTGATLTLTAQLAPPPRAGATSRPSDFNGSDVKLPDSVTIVFAQTSATVKVLGASSLSLYGNAIALTWNGDQANLIAGFPAILIPCAPNIHDFAFSSVTSTFKPSGKAPINVTGWSLPLATTTIGALGEASGAGSLVLELGAGATLDCVTRKGSARISGWLIGLDTAKLIAIAGGVGQPNFVAYSLWNSSPATRPPSTVDWVNPAGFFASLAQTLDQDIIVLTGATAAFLDRPLAADGGALPIGGAGLLVIAADAASVTVLIRGQGIPPATKFSLAFENALIGVHAPQLILVLGRLAHPTEKKLERADVWLALDALWALPTLPDPYAANFDASIIGGEGSLGTLVVGVAWSGKTDPHLAFALLPTASAGAASKSLISTLAPGEKTPTVNVAHPSAVNTSVLTVARNVPPVAAAVEAAAMPQSRTVTPEAASSGGWKLLDLSTRVDLLGVHVTGRGVIGGPAPKTGFVGLSVAIGDSGIATFALPQLSWEPMVDAAVTPPAFLGPLPATDGGATIVHASDPKNQTLVQIAPEPVLLRTIENVQAGASFMARFSLPFGMIASISQPNEPPTNNNPSRFLFDGGAFDLVQPNFSMGAGAYQLSMRPTHPKQPNAKFAGSTLVSTAGAAPGYGVKVLGDDVATIFESEFSSGGGVPVKRADLSGYGASIWSEWTDPGVKGTAIIKVQFETVVGRTAYEVVKAQTTLYPHGVRLVRTVTISRQNGGWVQRTDSGWVAATSGTYNFPNAAFPKSLVHPGAVVGVFNVRNVREFETVTASGFTYRRALFDADIGLDERVKVTAGGAKATTLDGLGNPVNVTLIPARDLTGYVQIAPDENQTPPAPKPDPAPVDLAQLFAQVGPITDLMSCMAEIGYTNAAAGTSLRCTGVSFAMTAGPNPVLGAALMSAPVLPHHGAWGFGKRAQNASAPIALAQGAPVPLVQSLGDPSNWRFADIADILNLNAPSNIYGLLQDTGTQRILFENPLVKDLTGGAPPGVAPAIQLPPGVAPALADLGSLLGATGLFPDIAKTISFLTGAVEQLKNIPEGLQYAKDLPFKGDEDPNTLLDLGILRVDLVYADTDKGKSGGKWSKPTDISFNIDPGHTSPNSKGRNWWLTIEPISFAVTIPEFGSDPLLTIIGGFGADDRSKPGLTGLTISYGAALESLKTVFSKLQALASFLPGGAGARLDVTLSGGKLVVRDNFALPTLPLGLGDLSDISLDLGLALTLSPLSADFLVGIGSPDRPFNWIVSPLAGNGVIEVGVKNNSPDFLIQAGIGLGLAIDVGIASGSASITLAFQLEVDGSAITVKIILNGQASVDVLGGLVSASLSLTAAIGVTIDPLPIPKFIGPPPGIEFPAETITFLASVAVGIHISICWVISVDFEGSWQFSQSVHTPQLEVQI